MPIVLYGLGALCVIAGGIIGYLGFPDREFSFGNTLILTGTIAIVGGLILIALATVVARLQRLIEAGPSLGARQMATEPFEAAPAAAGGRIAFPPRPKSEPRPAAFPAELPPPEPEKPEPFSDFAPKLPNPDEPPRRVAEEVPLSPPPQPALDLPVEPREEAPVTEPVEGFDKDWPAPAPERRSKFGFKWPERKPAKKPEPEVLHELPAEPEEAPPSLDPFPSVEAEQPAEPELVTDHPRDVAVLKSGVVDGMGYTLYVDGSIEAELPQGTLRFASINELRQHLEQNT